MRKIAGIVAAFALAVAFAGCEGLEETAAGGNEQVERVEEKTGKKLTESQKQAIASASSYLEMSGFSKKGLIQQLSSKAGEGFPKKDAVFAVNHVQVNWKQEAVQSARTYLEMSSFSRDGLIRQLTSNAGDGFTRAQAEHAADKVGL